MTAPTADGRGRNSIQLRRYNKRLVLRALRRMGEASKADLARATNLTNTAVGSIIESLAEDGLVLLGKKRHDGQRGQPAQLIHLNPEGVCGLGVRLDRSGIEIVLINFDGVILSRKDYDFLLPSPEKVLDIVTNDVDEILGRLPSFQKDRLAGIGLALPYNLGSWHRELGLAPDTFRPWDEFDFHGELEKRTGIPVHSENDGTAAAIAELFYGVGRKYNDFLYLFIGPAIGGGVVINGECHLGMMKNAGDVAVMPVPASSLPSAPKPKGPADILLTRASLNSLRRHLRFHGYDLKTKREVETAVAQKIEAVEEWLDDCVEALAPCLLSGCALLDVPVVVLDTDVDSGLIKWLRNKLEPALTDFAAEARTPPRLVSGSFRSNAGAIGAASLPMFFSFSPYAAILTNNEDSSLI